MATVTIPTLPSATLLTTSDLTVVSVSGVMKSATGLVVAKMILGSGQGLKVNAALASNAANQGILDYSSGVRLRTFGSDASTLGLFTLSSQSSDGSISATHVAIAANKEISLGGAAGSEVLRLSPIAGTPVNYIEMQSAVTTGAPWIKALGSDTNVSLSIISRGTGSIEFNTNSSNTNIQAAILHTTSANRYITLTGGVSGSSTNAKIGTNSGRLELVPSTGRVMVVGSTAGILLLNVSGGAANQKNWSVISLSSSLDFRATDDADSNDTVAYQIGRGTTYNVSTHTWNTSTTAGTAIRAMYIDSSAVLVGSASGTSLYVTRPTGSWVNYVAISGALTTGRAILQATGSDDDVGLSILGKGAGDVLITRPLIKDARGVINALGSVSSSSDVDLTLGNIITATLTGDTTFVFGDNSSYAASGTYQSWEVRIAVSSFTPTFERSSGNTVTWDSVLGAPTIAADKTLIVQFSTSDGGTTVMASFIGCF